MSTAIFNTDYFVNKTSYLVNSANRISGSPSNFQYLFDIDPSIDFTHVCLISVSIPKTFYGVPSDSFFILTEGGTSINIVPPAGNYSRNSFALVVTELLNTNSPNGWVYNITFPNINRGCDNGHYTFSVEGNAGNQPSFTINESLDKQMGFYVGEHPFVGDTLESENVCNLNPENVLVLHSSMVNERNGHLKAIMSSGTNSFDYIIYHANQIHENSKKMVRSKNNVYTFTLTDSNNQLIELNGSEIVFTIIIFHHR